MYVVAGAEDGWEMQEARRIAIMPKQAAADAGPGTVANIG